MRKPSALMLLPPYDAYLLAHYYALENNQTINVIHFQPTDLFSDITSFQHLEIEITAQAGMKSI